MKQAQENPWQAFEASHNKGDQLTVAVKSITDFGLFVGLPGGIDGLIHLADISWEKLSPDQVVATYSKGQEIDVVVLNIDAEKERISLGIKQLNEDDFGAFTSGNKTGNIVEGVISNLTSNGAEVELADGISGFIKISEVSNERVDDINSVLKVGDSVSAVITNIDKRSRKVNLSIKAKDYAEEKAAVESYNKQSSDAAGSTLGDIFNEGKE